MEARVTARRRCIFTRSRATRSRSQSDVWARLKSDTGEIHSFAILTGPPNELVAGIHDRMPIVLPASAYAAWLEPSLDAAGAKQLLGIPSPAGWLVEPVSTRVNSALNDDPACIAPPAQRSLF